MEKTMLPIYGPDRMPYVLKESGPIRTLAVRIGGILTELWEYKKGDAQPYARLIKESGEPTGKMKIGQEAPFQATLSPMEVLIIAGAIEEWKGLLAAGTKGSKTPCAVIQVDRLTIKLYNPARRQSAYAELFFVGPEEKTELALLSPTEVTVLAGTVGIIAPDCFTGVVVMTYDEKIAKALLAYSRCAGYEKVSSCPDLSGWGISSESVEFLENNPNAFFFAVLFDRMLQWERAWEAPLNLKRRLGHLNVNRISKMKVQALADVLGKGESQKALVRFPYRMAQGLISACQTLMNRYGGDARNIWQGATAAVVIKRLSEFEGISQKIANMTARFLGTYYGVRLDDWEKIDIPVDRHVARLFLRTGLVLPANGNKDQRVAMVKDAIIRKARLLSPGFPGALDEPAFEIGKYWCTAEEAYCDYKGEPCPLSKLCKRLTTLNVN